MLVKKESLNKIELLAPAGTKDAFYSAIENGADAVYVGLKSLNARALARNFSISEVAALTTFAHEAGVKLFVALNSLVKEAELPVVVEMLAALQEIGVDAVIVQDLAVWRIARRYFPALRLHASTLMGIHNSWGVKQAQKMGFKRVVLAREMTLHEIKKAVDVGGIEIEVFVHGAMCFTCSGSCLMSSYFGGKSSMRGRCVQPCRRQYNINGRPGFYFSMLDLCGIDNLPKLAEIGVSSIKLEGRLKPANYVATVVRAYRMVLDSLPLLHSQPQTYHEILRETKVLLDGAMGRDYTHGFFSSPYPKDILAPNKTANTGKYLGKVVDNKDGVVCIRTDFIIKKGDRLRIVFPDAMEQISSTCHGVEKRDDGIVAVSFGKSMEMPLNSLVFKTDQRTQVLLGPPFYDTSSWEKQWPELLSAQRGLHKKATAHVFHVKQELVREQKVPQKKRHPPTKPMVWVKLGSPVMFEMAKAFKPDGIIVEIDPKNTSFFLRHWHGDICWAVPPIIYEAGVADFEPTILRLLRAGQRLFMVSNLGQIAWLTHLARRGNASELHLWGGYVMNLLNSQALVAVSELGLRYAMFSVETDEKNLSFALEHVPSISIGMTVFGYLPLFTSRLKPFERPERLEIISPKGEKFWWHNTSQTGCLFSDTPFSLFHFQKRLQELGVSRQVIDLTYWPSRRRFPNSGKKRELGMVFYAGKRFNFADELL